VPLYLGPPGQMHRPVRTSLSAYVAICIVKIYAFSSVSRKIWYLLRGYSRRSILVVVLAFVGIFKSRHHVATSHSSILFIDNQQDRRFDFYRKPSIYRLTDVRTSLRHEASNDGYSLTPSVWRAVFKFGQRSGTQCVIITGCQNEGIEIYIITSYLE
jgi:hypothetical protein